MVPVHSYGAKNKKKKKEKLKPVTVKWPRLGYGTNAIALLNGTMIARSGEMDGSC